MSPGKIKDAVIGKSQPHRSLPQQGYQAIALAAVVHAYRHICLARQAAQHLKKASVPNEVIHPGQQAVIAGDVVLGCYAQLRVGPPLLQLVQTSERDNLIAEFVAATYVDDYFPHGAKLPNNRTGRNSIAAPAWARSEESSTGVNLRNRNVQRAAAYALQFCVFQRQNPST